MADVTLSKCGQLDKQLVGWKKKLFGLALRGNCTNSYMYADNFSIPGRTSKEGWYFVKKSKVQFNWLSIEFETGF